MTDQLQPSADQPLPGLGDPDSSRPSQLELQVRRSLAYMAQHNLVDARHAGLMQLALELARSIRPGEKAYGVAQCAAQLIATFDKLMPDDEGAGGDGWSELRAYLAGVDAAGSSAPLRDPS